MSNVPPPPPFMFNKLPSMLRRSYHLCNTLVALINSVMRVISLSSSTKQAAADLQRQPCMAGRSDLV